MNYYELLNIKESATEEEIKKAYKKLAMKFHPDRTSGNKELEEKFKEINEAYTVLSDSNKRKQYDYSLKNEGNFNQFNSRNMDDLFGNSFEEIFKNFGFNNFQEQSRRIRKIKVDLNFWEAIFGCSKTFDFNIENQGNKKIQIQFDPGINDGDTILIQVGNNEIYLQVNILKEEGFERLGYDIIGTLEVPFIKGILGGKVIYPHWSKEIEINIPEGINNGAKIRLTGLGIKKNNIIGDLYLIIKLVTPKKLTKKQKDLLLEFDLLTKEEKKESIFNQSLRKIWNKFFNK